MAGTVKGKRADAAKTYQVLGVPDQSGGLDFRHAPTQMAPDRARVLRNHALTNPGELPVRPGWKRFSTTNLGNSAIQGGARVYLANPDPFTLIAHNGAVYPLDDDGTLHSTAVYSTISPTNQVFFPYDRTIVAVFDSTNRPRKSTGSTTWTLMGIDAPSSIAVVSSLSSGSMSASEFEFSYSFKDRGTGHESNETTLVSTRTLGATGAMHITISNSTDPQVDAAVIYARNKTAGESDRRKATSGALQGGAGSDSTYRILSSNWSANDVAPSNHNVPLAYTHAIPWKNRWWAWIGNRLYFTELFQPQSWPTLFYIEIPFEKGDEITAGIAQGDVLVVFGQSKPFLIIGQTSLDFEVRPSAGAQAGALGPRSVALIENGIVHASAEGVFIFDGATDRYLTFDTEVGWRDLVKNTAAAALQKVAVTYHFPYKELRIAVPRLYPRGVAGEWVLDLNRTREKGEPAWTDTDRSIGGYILHDGDEPTAGLRGQLLTWHPSTQGTVFKESTGTSANNSNMVAEYEGPHLSMGLNRVRVIDLRGEYEPHGGTFSAEVVVDDQSQGSRTVEIGSGVSLYGTAVYGTAGYGGPSRKMYHIMQPLRAEGRSAWVKTQYQGQEAFKQYGYHLGIVPEPKPRAFSE
jgi:hypothetical protein